MNSLFLRFSGLNLKSFHYKLYKGFASKMQASSTNKTKDSAGRRLGVKKFGGQEVFPNDILLRQRGLKWKPGKNTISGKDHTIHSKIEGKVKFEYIYKKKTKKTVVHVEPNENPNRLVKPPPPYCYHPELFPERAQFNPKPTNYPVKKITPIPKPKIAHWFGQKMENSQSFLQIQIPGSFAENKVVAPPKLEFEIYPMEEKK